MTMPVMIAPWVALRVNRQMPRCPRMAWHAGGSGVYLSRKRGSREAGASGRSRSRHRSRRLGLVARVVGHHLVELAVEVVGTERTSNDASRDWHHNCPVGEGGRVAAGIGHAHGSCSDEGAGLAVAPVGTLLWEKVDSEAHEDGVGNDKQHEKQQLCVEARLDAVVSHRSQQVPERFRVDAAGAGQHVSQAGQARGQGADGSRRDCATAAGWCGWRGWRGAGRSHVGRLLCEKGEQPAVGEARQHHQPRRRWEPCAPSKRCR